MKTTISRELAAVALMLLSAAAPRVAGAPRVISNAIENQLAVTWAGSGAGRVTSSPAAIDCTSTCSANFLSTANVELTAAANSGSVFAGWSGEGCSGRGTCTVAMSAARNVTATFQVISTELHGTVLYNGSSVSLVSNAPGAFRFWSNITGGEVFGPIGTYDPATGQYTIYNLQPQTNVDISITSRSDQRGTFPGFYRGFDQVDIAALDSAARLNHPVVVRGTIHLKKPFDNSNTHPYEYIPYRYFAHTSPMTIEWDPYPGTDTYYVRADRWRDHDHPNGYGYITNIQQDYITGTSYVVPLTTGDLEYTEISVAAYGQGQLLAESWINFQGGFTGRYPFRVTPLPLVSTRPPQGITIDGTATNAEWSGAARQKFGGGSASFRNDGRFLYVLLDLTGDTTNEGFAPYDRAGVSFDVNHNDGSDDRDVKFGTDTAGTPYCGDVGQTGGPALKLSAIARGFGASPYSATPHRIWEFAIRLIEIGTSSSRNVELALEAASGGAPYLDTAYPSISGTNFLAKDTMTVTLAPSPDGIGDFSGDLQPDVVLRNYQNGANAIWTVQGGYVGSIADLPALVDVNFRIEGTADFDGDGDSDILLRNYQSGANAIWLMNGTAFQGIVDLPALPNTSYHFQGTGDFDLDGDPDIFIRNYATGSNAIWRMDHTSFVGVTDLPALTNLDFHIIGSADFSGDGKPDIVLRNQVTGANAFWVFDRWELRSIVDLPALADTSYYFGGLADFNGDAKPDIIIRNQSDGRDAVWLMNGTTLGSVLDLPQIANTAWEIAGPR